MNGSSAIVPVIILTAAQNGVYRSDDWAETFTPEADSEPPDTQSMNHWAGFEVVDRFDTIDLSNNLQISPIIYFLRESRNMPSPNSVTPIQSPFIKPNCIVPIPNPISVTPISPINVLIS